MIKKCKICGKEFEAKSKTYILCSDECRKINHRAAKNEWWHKKNPDSIEYTEGCYGESRCIICGKTYMPQRYNQVTCSTECRKKHRNNLQKERYKGDSWGEWVAKQKRINLIKREKSKAKREKEKAERMREGVCEVCGNTFRTLNPSQITCSTQCAKHWKYRRRDRRLKGKIIDNNITLEALYKLDSGVCYLCGCKCDWNDKQITPEGYQITGDSYPTIEHVIPLALGGMHSWDNVKLACFKCNVKKGASIPEGYEQEQRKEKPMHTRRGKEVYQYDKNGTLIKKYPSTAQAEKETGIKKKGIQNCARQETKSYHGFVWKYGGL